MNLWNIAGSAFSKLVLWTHGAAYVLLSGLILLVPDLAQAQKQTWDFDRLTEPTQNPRAEVTIKGLIPKVRELNDSIIGDETARTRQRNSERSADSLSSSTQASSTYQIYKDKGRAPHWAWFKQEVVIKCVGGRENGNLPSVYLVNSGQWKSSNRYFSTLDGAASAACGN